jgi:hypothetical protein
MLDLRLDLTPDNKISSTNSSALNEEIQTMSNTDLIVKSEIPPVGIFHDPILIEGMINSNYYIDGYMYGSEFLLNYAQLLM